MKDNKREMSYFALRVLIGLLFLIPGVFKIMNPNAFIGMLESMSFPIPFVLGWVVIICEILCGAAIIIGWNTKKATIPLLVIIIIGLIIGIITLDISNQASIMNVMWHLVGLAALSHISTVGSGKFKI
jgi:uncharacterized membrane protein YphA (DoxX/SURF4 family)